MNNENEMRQPSTFLSSSSFFFYETAKCRVEEKLFSRKDEVRRVKKGANTVGTVVQ